MSCNSKMYKKQGVPKGVDASKHERCIRQVKQKNVKNPYAVCNASLQKKVKTKEKSMNKSKEKVRDEIVKSLTEKFEGKDLKDSVRAELLEEVKKALAAGYDTAEPAPEEIEEVDPGINLKNDTEEKPEAVTKPEEDAIESEQVAEAEPNFGNLFKPFALGPSLKQTQAGNVVEGIKQPSMDYDKVAKESVRNEVYVANDKGELVKKD